MTNQNDFYFVDSIYSGWLARKADKEGLDSLTLPERAVMLSWWAKGEIDNGGFALLYSKPVSIDDVAAAFLEVGALDAHKACLDSKLIFHNKTPPQSVEERIKIIEAIPDNLDPWIKEERAIWSLGDNFDSTVANYARRNGIEPE